MTSPYFAWTTPAWLGWYLYATVGSRQNSCELIQELTARDGLSSQSMRGTSEVVIPLHKSGNRGMGHPGGTIREN